MFYLFMLSYYSRVATTSSNLQYLCIEQIILLYFYNRLFTFYTTFLLCRFFTRNFFTQTFFYRLGCPIFASYIFSLRSETKRNRNRFASFAKRTKLVFALFRLIFFCLSFLSSNCSLRFTLCFLIFSNHCFFFVCESNLHWC